jgi:hypothetical protein
VLFLLVYIKSYSDNEIIKSKGPGILKLRRILISEQGVHKFLLVVSYIPPEYSIVDIGVGF